MSNLAEILAFTFAQEGGYQVLWADPGNWTAGRVNAGDLVGTNRGISAPVLAHWRHNAAIGRPDMQNLSLDEATAIAGALFGNPLQVDAMTRGPDLMAFELAWGSGLKFGAESLQRAVGAVADGFIGPVTLGALATADCAAVIASMDEAVRALYVRQPAFRTFGDGWLARADRRLAAATARLTTGAAAQV